MKTATDSVVLEFVEDYLKPAIEKGYVYDKDTLDDEYMQNLYDLISLKTPNAIIEENGNFHLSGTMIADEVVGMYEVYDMTFDMALEIVKEKIEIEIRKQDLLDLYKEVF